ncbi:MAG: RelA/SpoT family protein [Candidatus Comchoanobacterales bacterium]
MLLTRKVIQNNPYGLETLKQLIIEHTTHLCEDDIAIIMQAVDLAEAAHQGQYRRSGEPYITHPVDVACILGDLHMDVHSIVAGVMHDVLEDTPTTKGIIKQQFGDVVANIVDGVSKLNNVTFETKVEAQAENFRKMLLAMSDDIRVIIVKLSDRLHNMRTLDAMSRTKQRRISRETLEIYAPIAKRLGMHDLSLELENLGFRWLYPLRYQVIQAAIDKVFAQHEHTIEHICQNFQRVMAQKELNVYDISGREKHLYSIYRKMKSKRVSFDELTDVYGIRIVLSDDNDCYRAMGYIHALYKPMSQKFKDYIALPKANGYQSLHTVLFGPYGLPIEVQIRTLAMDRLANRGVAAHWLYKTGDAETVSPQLHMQQWLKDLIEMQRKTGNSIEFIENVKIDLFPNDVYVFTPKGQIIELPAGATPIDLAYAIHTDIGHHCAAAKVDRQLVPLSTELHSGQTVEVITNNNASPSEFWLSLVKSGKAKSSIRHFLRDQRKGQSMRLGERLLTRALSEQGIAYNDLTREAKNNAAFLLECRSLDEVLADIGLGKRSANLVVRQCFMQNHTSEKQGAKPLLVTGTEGMVVRFSSCCCPIPGDEIMGLLSVGDGILIHRHRCQALVKAVRLGEKTVMVSWSSDVQGDFLIFVRVHVMNKRGSLANIAMAVSNANANIEDIFITDHQDQHAVVRLQLKVRDRIQLANVLRHIRKITDVTKVMREEGM